MPEAGLRELKARASEIVRQVRERRASYVITHRGRPVAVLRPVEPYEAAEEEGEDGPAWEELVGLGQVIGKGWKSRLTSADLLSRMRR